MGYFRVGVSAHTRVCISNKYIFIEGVAFFGLGVARAWRRRAGVSGRGRAYTLAQAIH